MLLENWVKDFFSFREKKEDETNEDYQRLTQEEILELVRKSALRAVLNCIPIEDTITAETVKTSKMKVHTSAMFDRDISPLTQNKEGSEAKLSELQKNPEVFRQSIKEKLPEDDRNKASLMKADLSQIAQEIIYVDAEISNIQKLLKIH